MKKDMKNYLKPRNKPIATVIRNFINKESGKVTDSRKEIQRRFFGLDWKDQKKIMMAFLDAGASDRQWAYSRLLDWWDPYFEPKVQELWEAFHEERCAWVVIRHFPLSYLKENKEQLWEGRNYYFISRRLAKDKDYVIDRARMSNTDYLSVLYHSGREISDDEARDIMFEIVHDCCFESPFTTRLEQTFGGHYPQVVTMTNFRAVNLAIYYLLRMDKFETVTRFAHWNDALEMEIFCSPEFMSIDRNSFSSEFDYDRRRLEVTQFYAYKVLEKKYKRTTDPVLHC